MPTKLIFARRKMLKGVGAILANFLLPFAQSVRAQSIYPNKSIRIVVPFAPGGTLDVPMRSLSQALSGILGQTVYIDNRPGANGVIGAEYVAKSIPDGYTLLATSASFVLNPSIYKGLKYDVIRDFTPIAGLMKGVGFVLIVNPLVSASTLHELILLGTTSSPVLTYSSPGIGNTIHIASELFNQKAGTHFLHVPYKGSAPALNAIISGEVQIGIMPPGTVMPFIRGGKLKALAFTGVKRFAELPDIPTMAEAGVADFVFEGTWQGLFGPNALPIPVMDRLYGAITTAYQQPQFRQTLLNSVPGYVPDGSSPNQFSKQVRDDLQRYGDILRKMNIQPI